MITITLKLKKLGNCKNYYFIITRNISLTNKGKDGMTGKHFNQVKRQLHIFIKGNLTCILFSTLLSTTR